MKIEAAEAEYLYIDTSKIENAGKGLFSTIDIYKDEIICYYQGKILNQKEIKQRVDKNEDQYFIEMLDGTIMDSKYSVCFAKYANDASYKSIAKNNSKISLDDDDKVCLLATKKIKAGEEIYCSYGSKYWEKHG